MIANSQSLECLGSVGLETHHAVPSWVPDWHVRYDRIAHPFIQQEQGYQLGETFGEQGLIVGAHSDIFAASKRLAASISFNEMENQLKTQGIRYDTVKEVSAPRIGNDESVEESWESWTAAIGPKDSMYISGCSRDEAFHHVLRGGFGDLMDDWSADRIRDWSEFRDEYLSLNTSNVFKLQNKAIDIATRHRRLIFSCWAYIGLAPATTEPGDAICIILGSQMPIVLRAKSDHWICVGQAYIHGIMDGEALEGVEAGGSKQWQEFAIK